MDELLKINAFTTDPPWEFYRKLASSSQSEQIIVSEIHFDQQFLIVCQKLKLIINDRNSQRNVWKDPTKYVDPHR